MKRLWQDILDAGGLLLFCAALYFGAWALVDISDEQAAHMDGVMLIERMDTEWQASK